MNHFQHQDHFLTREGEQQNNKRISVNITNRLFPADCSYVATNTCSSATRRRHALPKRVPSFTFSAVLSSIRFCHELHYLQHIAPTSTPHTTTPIHTITTITHHPSLVGRLARRVTQRDGTHRPRDCQTFLVVAEKSEDRRSLVA